MLVIGIGLYAWRKFKNIYQETKSRQLLNSVPGIFTSLGIFFTFVSICISLGGISDVPTVTNNVGKTVEDAQNNDVDIIQIIGDLIPAFTTSIWGIIFALWTNYKSRKMFAYEDKAYDEKHHTPEENIEFIRQAADSIFCSNKNIEIKLGNLLGSLGNLLGSNINMGNKLDSILSSNKNIGNELNSILGSNINMGTTLGSILGSNKNMENKLGSTLNYSKTTENKLDGILSHMKAQDELTKSYNEQLNFNISQQSAILEKFINDFVNRMDDIFAKMHDAVEKQIMAFGQSQFQKTSDVMQKLVEEIQTMSKSILNKQNITVTEMMTETNDKISKITDNLLELTKNIGQKNTEALDELSKSQKDKLNVIIDSYNQLSQSSLS